MFWTCPCPIQPARICDCKKGLAVCGGCMDGNDVYKMPARSISRQSTARPQHLDPSDLLTKLSRPHGSPRRRNICMNICKATPPCRIGWGSPSTPLVPMAQSCHEFPRLPNSTAIRAMSDAKLSESDSRLYRRDERVFQNCALGADTGIQLSRIADLCRESREAAVETS